MNLKRILAVLHIVLILTLIWFTYPMLIPQTSLIELSIEDPHPVAGGLWVNFTVMIANKGVWPLTLNDLNWEIGAICKIPTEARWAQHERPFPKSVSLRPLETLSLDAYVRYSEASLLLLIFRNILLPGTGVVTDLGELKITKVEAQLTGTISTYGALGLTASFKIYKSVSVPY